MILFVHTNVGILFLTYEEIVEEVIETYEIIDGQSRITKL